MTLAADLHAALGSERYSRTTLADGTGVVLDLESMRVLSLNRSGMFVLEAIAGGVSELAVLEQRLVETFEVDAETAAADLRELLDELGRHLGSAAQS